MQSNRIICVKKLLKHHDTNKLKIPLHANNISQYLHFEPRVENIALGFIFPNTTLTNILNAFNKDYIIAIGSFIARAILFSKRNDKR